MAEAENKQKLIAWLNNAYLMEREIVTKLQHHLEDAKDTPVVKTKIEEHIDLTKEHADKVKHCIEMLGGDISGLKEAIAKLMGNISGVSMDLVDDKVVANAIAEFATENLEIASYQAIVILATKCREDHVRKICEEIIKDEVEMAKWLKDNLEKVVNTAIIT